MHEKGSPLPSKDSSEPHGLLRILLSVFSGVLFGSLLSRLQTPPQQKSVNSTHDQDTTQSTSQNISPPEPIRVKVESLPPAPQNEESREERKEGRDKINLIAACLTAGLVFVYATVAIFQWCEMKKATRATQTQ
jgi:hypothetical protein